jgi:hypothetical protein
VFIADLNDRAVCVGGRSIVGIAGSNSARDMDIRFLCLFCVVCDGLIIPTGVRLELWVV